MEIFIRICIYVAFFVFGALAVHFGLLRRSLSDKLLWLLFHFAIPISLFYAITSTKLDPSLLILPFIAVSIVAIEGIIAMRVGGTLRLPKSLVGVMAASTMIMNTSFSLPFFTAFYGTHGLAVLSLFDLGNVLMVFTVTYFVALSFGGKHPRSGVLLKRILISPPLWAIVISVLLMFNGFTLPPVFHPFFSSLLIGIFCTVMFTLGMLFQFSKVHFPLVALTIFLRIGVGFLLGLLFVTLFSIEGVARSAILVGASSPNGYTSLVYSRMAKLDLSFASQVVSLSLGISIIFIPLLLYLIGRL